MDGASRGGYTWAREGYEFDGEQAVFGPDIPRSAPVPEVVIMELERKLLNGEFARPADIAVYGFAYPYEDEETGDATWVGRQFLEGASWHGVKKLQSEWAARMGALASELGLDAFSATDDIERDREFWTRAQAEGLVKDRAPSPDER